MAKKKKKDLPNYELSVSSDYRDEFGNVVTTSLVDNPAVRRLFAVFSDDNKATEQLDFNFDFPAPKNKQIVNGQGGKFERIISGVWFMPDVNYYRNIGGEEFTTSIKRDELKTAVSNFIKSGATSNFNIMHDGENVEGLQMYELWVLDSYEKTSPILNNSLKDLGYEEKNVPLGTVLMSVFVENEKFFKDEILSGNLRGFSIEAWFALEQKFNNHSKFKSNMSKRKELFAKLGLDQTNGKVITKTGTLNFADDGILNGETAVNDGTFELNSGLNLTIAGGVLVAFNDATPPATEPPVTPPTTEPVTPPTTETAPTTDISKQVADAVAALEAKRKAEAEAAEATKKAEEDAAELERLREENETLKGGQAISRDRTTKVTADYDQSKFQKIQRFGEEFLVLKH